MAINKTIIYLILNGVQLVKISNIDLIIYYIKLHLDIIITINENFDFVILTGSLNTHLFVTNINKEKVLILKDKSEMEVTLAKTTRVGDLILFANDAPNFI